MSATRPSVLHLIDTTGPGGAETVFLNVADGLRRRDWPPRTVVVGPGWVLDRVRQLELPVDVVETRGRLDWRYLGGLHQILRRHRIGLIHAHLFSPAVYASALGAWTGVPVVASFHGASDAVPGSWSRRLRYRLVARRARVVCVSEALRDAVRAIPAMAGAEVEVIHNGVDVARFAAARGTGIRREHGVPDDAILVGAVGNIRPAKDYANFLRAAAELAGDRRLAFAVVGERTEPLHGELVALRDRLRLTERVAFWGFRNDIEEVMAAFDVLAISSSSEGFSLVAVQAMAAGTPVVATRSGGPETILTHDRDGLLVPTGSPKALAGGVRELVHRPDLRERLIGAARVTVRDRFSLERMLDGYEALYAELTGRSPR